MSITLTYNGSNKEVKRAVTLASEMLTTEEFLNIIRSRKIPFEDSKPKNLDPSRVANFFRDTNLALTVETYTNNDPDIGGYFDGDEPNSIYANLNNLPQRKDCSTAAMLIHECVHALSFNIGKNQKITFSHTGPRSGNNNTAPYWIQSRVRANLCKSPIADKDNVIIETKNNEEVQKQAID